MTMVLKLWPFICNIPFEFLWEPFDDAGYFPVNLYLPVNL